MTFNETVAYIKRHALFDQAAMEKSKRHLSTRRLRLAQLVEEETEADPEDVDNVERAIRTVTAMLKESDVITVYNTLQQPIVRESLFIPSLVWKELEPQLRIKVLEAKKRAQAKLHNPSGQGQSTVKPTVAKVPETNYPNKVNKVQLQESVINMVNQFASCNIDDESDDDKSIAKTRISRMVRHVNPDFTASSMNIEIKSDLERIVHLVQNNTLWAYSDGGADACVLGKGCIIESFVPNRTATLVGYDPGSTKSSPMRIATGCVKVMASNGIPVILKIHEAPHNEHSPITILPEHQIRGWLHH